MRAHLLMAGVIAVAIGVACGAGVVEVEPNEAPSAAVSIGAFGAVHDTIHVNGEIDYPGDIDWYGLAVQTDSIGLVMAASASEVEVRLVVYDAELGYLHAAENRATLEVGSGDYFLRVDAKGLATGAYELMVTNAVEREPNDGVGMANDLGIPGEEPSTIHGAIDPVADNDYYRFEVPDTPAGGSSAEYVLLETSGPGGDTIIVLYAFDDTCGRFVPAFRDDDGGTDAWSAIFAPLTPGEYIVRVEEYAENGTIDAYEFSVSRFSIQQCEPNNSLEEACDLGVVSIGQTVEYDDLLDAGDVDHFAFTLEQEADVTAETSGRPSADSILVLYDSSGTILAEDDDGGDDLWSRIGRVLEAGTYTLRVSGYQDEEPFRYTLIVRAAEAPESFQEAEPNDSFSAAMDLTPHALPLQLEGGIDGPEDVDFYRFRLEGEGMIPVSIETSGVWDEDTFLCLYDEAGNELVCDDDGGEGFWSLLEYELEAGTYFVAVEAYYSDDAFLYTLTLSVE